MESNQTEPTGKVLIRTMNSYDVIKQIKDKTNSTIRKLRKLLTCSKENETLWLRRKMGVKSTREVENRTQVRNIRG